MGDRRVALAEWAAERLRERGIEPGAGPVLEPVSGDASFRRYFRLRHGGASWICVDAPPDKEDSAPFVAIARHWQRLGIRVPEVLAEDRAQGFLLLDDFGDRLLLPELNPASADHLYGLALETLLRLQQRHDLAAEPLPPYDRALLEGEMALFRDWFLGRLLELHLAKPELRTLEDTFARLVESALEQPVVAVHRDYHSRNLMLLDDGSLGVLDFQDAVAGPVSYDLVSLLRDCYIAWPADRVRGWVEAYRRQAEAAGLIAGVESGRFWRWFELMGMQRHLKAIGIFARLKIRDGKGGYLGDIPRTMEYLLAASAYYPEFAGFCALLVDRVLPAMARSGLFAGLERPA